MSEQVVHGQMMRDGRLDVKMGWDVFHTYTTVTVGTSSTLILPNNVKRILAIFVSATDADLFLSFGAPAVLNKGIPLYGKGSSYEISPAFDNMDADDVYAISTSSVTLLITEGTPHA